MTTNICVGKTCSLTSHKLRSIIRDFWRENTKMIMMMTTTRRRRRRRWPRWWCEGKNPGGGSHHPTKFCRWSLIFGGKNRAFLWHEIKMIFFSNIELEQCNRGGFKLHKAILKTKDTKCSHMATTGKHSLCGSNPRSPTCAASALTHRATEALTVWMVKEVPISGLKITIIIKKMWWGHDHHDKLWWPRRWQPIFA